MPDIVVNDITPRVQYVSGAGQITFAYGFPIFALTDLKVYKTPFGTASNDVNQLLTYNVAYTVTNNVAPAVGGTITLTVPASVGDIITIVRDQPDDRLNNYVDGGLFQATTVNTDFDRTVFMSQQDKMYDKVIGVHYNNSEIITPVTDNILPKLSPNTVWMMNNAGTAITAVTSFTGGAGTITLPTVANKIAYFTNTTGNLSSSIFSTPTVDGSLGDSITTNGAGVQRVATVPGRNRIINGDFQVWQRGAGGSAIIAVPASSNIYTADRWVVSTNPNQASTVTQTAGATSGSYLCKVQRNNGQTGVVTMQITTSLPRDMCIDAAGKKVTLSFKAKAGANFSSAGSILNASIVTGTGATDVSFAISGFTGQATPAALNQAITTTLTNYSITTPTLSSTVTQLGVAFDFTPVGTADVDDSFFITDCMLEVSPNQSPFDRIGFQDTLQACKRFYQKSFVYATAPAQNVGVGSGEAIFVATVAGANTNRSSSFFFPVEMRANPATFTTYSPAAASGQVYDETAAGVCTATATSVNAKLFNVTCTANAGTAIGNALGVHWSAEIELT